MAHGPAPQQGSWVGQFGNGDLQAFAEKMQEIADTLAELNKAYIDGSDALDPTRINTEERLIGEVQELHRLVMDWWNKHE